MKYAIISDLHANAEALQCALKDIAREGVDCIACLGDIVGYGPQPREALTLVRRFCGIVLAGNHDDAVAGRITADDFIDLAGEAIIRHRAELASEQIDWLKSLPHLARIEGAIAAHGDVTNPTAFNYISNEAEALANFKASKSPLLFVGHTHIPGIFVIGAHGIVHQLPAKDFQMEAGKRYIVNPGSVGYPREENGVCHSSYILYDSAAQTIRFRFLPFSVASVMQRGTTKRHTYKWAWIAGALALVLPIIGFAVFHRPSSAVAIPTPEADSPAVTDEAQVLALADRVITIGSGHKFVRANLKMKPGDGGSVQLKIVFRDAERKEIAVHDESVKKSSAKKIAVPAGALTAAFSVYQADAKAPRRTIKSFSPTSVEK